jgi:hypothetical protein
VLAQLAQFEGRLAFFCQSGVREIKGLAGGARAIRRVVPTIPIFF